jgi:FkbM family methyltransferase
MASVARHLSDDLNRALLGAKGCLLYLTRARTVGKNAGVVRHAVAVAGGHQLFSYRYKSAGDRGVVRKIFYEYEYAAQRYWPQTIALQRYYESVVAQGRRPLILDAGANIGASCVYFSAMYPRSQIVAIEPEQNNCALLRLNSEGRSIRVIEGAIGAEPGTVFLSDPGLSDWGFRVAATGAHPVPVHTPSAILAEYPQGEFAPFICKIDIEGAEHQLFERNLEWMDQFALIVIELHDWMLPGSYSSRAFLKAIANRNFDFMHRGENVFCFNYDLLGQPRDYRE